MIKLALDTKECKIPVMIVGMPGTGKTLAVNIATSVLRGGNAMPFFRDFCDVANSVFRYQCLEPQSRCVEATAIVHPPIQSELIQDEHWKIFLLCIII